MIINAPMAPPMMAPILIDFDEAWGKGVFPVDVAEVDVAEVDEVDEW